MVDLKDRSTWPKVYSVWKHEKTGDEYIVELFTNVEGTRAKYPPTIIYRRKFSFMYYSRQLSDWDRSFTFVRESALEK